MTIVAVNGGGNLPQRVPGHTPEWSNLRSSDPMETPGGLPAGEQTDGYSGFVGGVTVASGDVNALGDTFDFKAEVTSEPTAPEPYQQLKLEDTLLSSWQVHGDGEAETDVFTIDGSRGGDVAVVDQFSMTNGQIEWTY